MPDGSPQTTRTWGDTDGSHVLLNSVDGHQKVQRDPRVALKVADLRPYPWFGGPEQVRLLVRIEPERVTSPRG